MHVLLQDRTEWMDIRGDNWLHRETGLITSCVTLWTFSFSFFFSFLFLRRWTFYLCNVIHFALFAQQQLFYTSYGGEYQKTNVHSSQIFRPVLLQCYHTRWMLICIFKPIQGIIKRTFCKLPTLSKWFVWLSPPPHTHILLKTNYSVLNLKVMDLHFR